MMEFELNTDSWHFKLANFGGRRVREWRSDNDLCSYIRAFLMGTCLFLFLATLVFFAGYLTGNLFYELYELFLYGTALSIWGEAAYMFYFGTTGVVMLLVPLWFIFEKVLPSIHNGFKKVMYGTHEKRNRPPGFIALTYRKFKEKTCFNIKFKTSE